MAECWSWMGCGVERQAVCFCFFWKIVMISVKSRKRTFSWRKHGKQWKVERCHKHCNVIWRLRSWKKRWKMRMNCQCWVHEVIYWLHPHHISIWIHMLTCRIHHHLRSPIAIERTARILIHIQFNTWWMWRARKKVNINHDYRNSSPKYALCIYTISLILCLSTDFQRATNSAVSYDDDILSMNCDEMDLFWNINIRNEL